MDSCLTKKPVEESACHPYNTRGSMSEVQSLSSFQSESCDDNGTLTLAPPRPPPHIHTPLTTNQTKQFAVFQKCHFAPMT